MTHESQSAKKAFVTNRWTTFVVTYDGSNKAAGVKIYRRWSNRKKSKWHADKLQSTIRTKVPLSIWPAQYDVAARRSWAAGSADLYARAETGRSQIAGQRIRACLSAVEAADKRTKTEKNELYNSLAERLRHKLSGGSPRLSPNWTKKKAAIKARGTEALVMHERTNAPEAYILSRAIMTNAKTT